VRICSACASGSGAAVVDYETFCKIRDALDRQHLTPAQTARELGLHPRTVWK
jgi:hypothetical protein